MTDKHRRTAKVLDMTEGNSMRLIIAFAIPLFIGSIFQQVYTLVDTMIVGHVLGAHAISAIGSTSSIHALMFNIAICLNNGFAIITTQAFGAHDDQKLRHSVAGMFVLNIAATVLLTTIALLFLRPMMHFMNTPEAIFEEAYRYVLILFLGLFSTAGYNMFAGILRAVGNSRTPLYCLIVSSLVNIVLDILLVAVIPMGVAGAALATVIAQIVSMVLCGAAFFRNYKDMIPKREEYRSSVKLWPSMLSAGAAMALMLCVVNIGSIIFQRANNGLGEKLIAAHTASYRVVINLMQPLSTLATACSTFVSQNWGAEKYDRIKRTMRNVMGLSALWGCISIGIVFLWGRWLVWLITGTEDAYIMENAVLNMRCVAVGLPALGVLLCLRTSMQSMGRKVAPVLSSCVELLMKSVGAFLLIPAYGFLGSSLTDPLTWFSMSFFLIIAYLIQRKHIYPQEEGA